MDQVKSLLSYLRGTVDSLVSFFRQSREISTKAAIEENVGPILVEELNRRGFTVIAFSDIEKFHKAINETKMDPIAKKVIKNYYKALKELVGVDDVNDKN